MQQRIPYDGNDLGAVYTKKYTAFRLWAPTADAVTLCLYREGDGDCLSDTLPMKRDVQGTWTIRVDGDLRHVYYTHRLETVSYTHLHISISGFKCRTWDNPTARRF